MALQAELAALAAACWTAILQSARHPIAALCNGCPAEGGLCSWPLEHDPPGDA